jgi:hypothetical protein
MTVEDPGHALTVGLVADPVGDGWQAASFRCPCGFATDDADEFDEHLDATEEAKLEHFEVLAGWTLHRVRQWQAATASSGGARTTVRAARRHQQDGHTATMDGGTAGPDDPAATVASPVLTAGSGLFDEEGRPLVVRMEVPLSAGEMVATLYGEHERLTRADLGTDQDVWRYVAVVVVQDGMVAVEQLADVIDEQERCGSLAAPEWLAWCRRRVAEVTARGVPASASRVR